MGDHGRQCPDRSTNNQWEKERKLTDRRTVLGEDVLGEMLSSRSFSWEPI
ncbi:hypothetical protein HXA32_17390 [Salipaludibacillus agaradhaerens]|nr:hypothetical protein [Salipaludibacillus agaradhaerens]MCR6108047.1 hypothetical protein [Salipaludibacillus agaradhaerens]